MEYNAFLLFLNQISSQKKAKVVIQGSVIFIETSSRPDYWSLSTKILDNQSKDQYLSRDSLRWQQKGAYLKADPHTDSIYLVQDVLTSKKYIPFKHIIEDFASVANEWKEILQKCSEEDITLFSS